MNFSLTRCPKFEFNHTNITILNLLREFCHILQSYMIQKISLHSNRLVRDIQLKPKNEYILFRGLVQNWKNKS